ncbi:hypothetical protein [Cupriavidus lacunae]|nr:hypothetical protein [Cupriavidus lacunae]
MKLAWITTISEFQWTVRYGRSPTTYKKAFLFHFTLPLPERPRAAVPV